MRVNGLIVVAVILAVAMFGFIFFLTSTEGPPMETSSPQEAAPSPEAGLASPEQITSPDPSPTLVRQSESPGASIENQPVVDPTPAASSPTSETSSAMAPLPSDAGSSAAANGQPSQATEHVSSLTFMVVNHQGKPVQGATLELGSQSSGQTGTDGLLTLSGPVILPKIVRVSHQRYQSHESMVRLQQAQQSPVKVTLFPQGALPGRVVDNLGQPIALARVEAKAQTGIWLRNYTTDTEGRFLIQTPPEGEISLVARMEGYEDEGGGQKVVSPPFGQEVTLTLSAPTLTISGRVLHKDTGQAIEDFGLIARPLRNAQAVAERTAYSGGGGRYSFEDLPKGSYRITPISSADDGQASSYTPLPDDREKHVRLVEWDVKDVNFYVVDKHSIRGRVVNANDQGIAEAMVRVDGVPSAQAVTDAQGGFLISGVPLPQEGSAENAQTAVRLLASHPEHGVSYSDPLPPASQRQQQEIVIELRGTASVKGTVLDANTNVLEGVRISIRPQGNQFETLEALTDAQGNFTINSVPVLPLSEGETPPTTHVLQAYKQGYSRVEEAIQLQAGDSPHFNLRLEAEGVIAGRITDREGRPLPNAQVSAYAPRHGSFHTTSNQQGQYRFEGLGDALYDITAEFPANPPMTATLYQVEVQNQQANLVLDTQQWMVSGPVWDEDTQQPILQYTIHIEGTPAEPRGRPFYERRVFNTPDGHYELTLTEPGEYRLLFVADGYESQPRTVRISQEIGSFQYIGAGLTPVEDEGEIAGTFVAAPDTELAAIEVLGHGSFPLSSPNFVLPGIPSGLHDLQFFVRDTQTGLIYRLGVLSSVEVQGGARTQLGEIAPLNIPAYNRESQDASL